MKLQNLIENNLHFYHGTSSALGIYDKILPPENTDKISELGRKKNLNKIFFTKDIKSALIYARKSVKRFGGQPIIYEINPVGNIDVVQDIPGTTVLMADSGTVVKQVY